MMRASTTTTSTLLSLLLLLFTTSCRAMYVEDAGVLDFTVATSGHGPVGYTYSYKDTIITSDKPTTTTSTTTSCFVSCRKQIDGTLLWRRNVCSVPSVDKQVHSITALDDMFYTTDNVGVLRGWSLEDGSLLWEVSNGENIYTSNPKVWTVVPSNSKNLVAVAIHEQLLLFDAITGQSFDKINALKAMAASAALKKGQHLEILAIVPKAEAGLMQIIIGFVYEDGIIQNGDLYVAELDIGNDFFDYARNVNKGKNIIASSFVLQSVGVVTPAVGTEAWYVMALTTSNTMLSLSVCGLNFMEEIAASKLHPNWTSLVKVESTCRNWYHPSDW